MAIDAKGRSVTTAVGLTTAVDTPQGRIPSQQANRRYWWFVLPAGIAVLVLFVIPVGYVIWLALRNYNLLIGTNAFAGIDNFVRALTMDTDFLMSIARTLFYVVLVVGTDFVVGMIQALLVYELAPKLRKVARTIFLLPVLL